MELLSWAIYIILTISIIASIIYDNRKDKAYKTTVNIAKEYQRKKYLKELKDGEK
jgi:hypothetical protein